MRRLAIVFGVFVLGAAVLAVIGVNRGVRFAPNSREQANLANSDKVWSGATGGMHEHSRFTSLADARWVPPFPSSGRTTNVGRYFDTSLADQAALLVWERAATSAGWALASARCETLNHEVREYDKHLGRWPAVLTVSYDVTGTYILVGIRTPANAVGAPGEARIGQNACPSP